MLTPLDPLDTVLLAEALDQAQSETETAHRRERIEREIAQAQEIVDRMAGEGKSLLEIARAIGELVGAPAEWIVEHTQATVAEIKELLAGGMDRVAVAETIAARLDITPGELLRGVDACAREMGEIP